MDLEALCEQRQQLEKERRAKLARNADIFEPMSEEGKRYVIEFYCRKGKTRDQIWLKTGGVWTRGKIWRCMDNFKKHGTTQDRRPGNSGPSKTARMEAEYFKVNGIVSKSQK